MYNVNTPLGPHRLCWVGRCHKHATKTLDNSLGNRPPRLRTKLAQALLNQIHSFHPRLLVANVCCIKIAINTERGVACNASTRAHRPRRCKGFSLARLIITVVVSHTETASPLQILRCLQRFRESVCCVRLRRFLDHRPLSFLVLRSRVSFQCA